MEMHILLKNKLLLAVLAFDMLLVSATAYAQFNSCGLGFCSAGGVSSPVTPCDQTGLDFSLNCNMVLIPALIH